MVGQRAWDTGPPIGGRIKVGVEGGQCPSAKGPLPINGEGPGQRRPSSVTMGRLHSPPHCRGLSDRLNVGERDCGTQERHRREGQKGALPKFCVEEGRSWLWGVSCCRLVKVNRSRKQGKAQATRCKAVTHAATHVDKVTQGTHKVDPKYGWHTGAAEGMAGMGVTFRH